MTNDNIDADIRRAQTPPSSWYRSESRWSEVIERVFPHTWHMVGDSGGERGHNVANGYVWLEPSCISAGPINEPIVLVHGAEPLILSNVCTHRGNILVSEPCAATSIRCSYHGRRFGLDGRCQFMPEFKDVENFPADADNLTRLPSGQWAGWLFAAMTSPTTSFDQWIAPLRERMSYLPLERARFDPTRSRDYTVHAHWALYVENYLEGFHIPFVHEGLNSVLDWTDYETVLFDRAVLQIGTSKDPAATFDVPVDHEDTNRNIAAYYWWLFPNLMINVYPWGVSMNIVEPVHHSLTRIRYRTYVMDPTRLETGAGSGLDTVEFEDEAVVEAVHRGMKSRLYNRGRYSPQREPGVWAFHRMLQDEGVL